MVGTSLSEPYANKITLCTCLYMLASLVTRPSTESLQHYLKWVIFNAETVM